MRVPYSWLKDFINLRRPPEAVARDLSLSSIGVKEIIGSGQEAVLDLDITYNRGDLLSILGVARELAALYRLTFKGEEERFKPPAGTAPLKVKVDPGLAKLYTLTKISHLSYKSTPELIQDRLEAAGMRPINLWADLTNYLMLEFGQPFHAFDAEKISRRDPTLSIEVRKAKKGERIRTLDGLDRDLSPEDIVIADKLGPIAIAGVMGGEATEVGEGTTEVILEAAIFDPISIRRTARRLGLRSEASNRFEHFISPDNLYISLNKIVKLYQLYGRGDVTAFISVGEDRTEPYSVGLTHEKLAAVAGEAIPLPVAREHLERLGFKVMASEKGLLCWPPFFRGDIRIPEDVAEEVLRMHGYDRISPKPLQTAIDHAGINALESWRDQTTSFLADSGFAETISFPFVSTQARLFLNQKELLKLQNPVSAEAEYLRPNLIFSLLEVAQKNAARQTHGRVFELGKTYCKEEVLVLGGLIWGEENLFLQTKGVLEALAQRMHLPLEFEPEKNQFLHPIEASQVKVENQRIGFLGTVHPHLAKAFGIPAAGAFEVNFEELSKLAKPWGAFVPISLYPEIYEEYSFILPENRSLGDLIKQLKEVSPLVREIEITDRFTTAEGKRSITLRITFQSDEKSLSGEDIQPWREKIYHLIKKRGGVPRI